MKKFLIIICMITSLIYAHEDAEFDEFSDEFAIEEKTTFDPLKKYNIFMTKMNDKVFIYVLNPVISTYQSHVDEPLRVSLFNVFDNLLAPSRFLNNLLQLKFRNSFDEFFRFVINSSMGIGGIGDAASDIFGIPSHHEDFGQTLGHWGLGSGFAVVLPFFGPSNLRDGFGIVVDGFLSPLYYVKPPLLSAGIDTLDQLNSASFHVGEYEAFKKDAIDLYPFLQEFYEKNRNEEIKN